MKTIYQQLEPGVQVEDFIPMLVQEGRVVEGEGGRRMEVGREAHHPTIGGVAVSQAQTFINERRVLVVSYNSSEPPGTLGYTVIVRPGCSVGDHYHHVREERLVLLHGLAEFRLQDHRRESLTSGLVNRFTVDYPGLCVCVPTGVAHSVIARGGMAVLQVLSSCDYDPHDDVHVPLSAL